MSATSKMLLYRAIERNPIYWISKKNGALRVQYTTESAPGYAEHEHSWRSRCTITSPGDEIISQEGSTCTNKRAAEDSAADAMRAYLMENENGMTIH